MSKIAIMACGSAGLEYHDINHGMVSFRSIIILDGKEYVDYEDLKADEFYELLAKAKDFHSAQVSTGTLLEKFEGLKKEGYTDIIAVSLSSGLSGTYQGVVLAADMIEGIKVHPYDSKFLGYSEATMIFKAKKMADSGKSVNEIIKAMDIIRDSQKTYVAVDNLKYLVHNGRLSAAAGMIATLLKIKPLLMTQDGKIVVKEKNRTKEKSVKRMIEIIIEDTKDLKDPEVYVLYTNNKAEAEEVCKRIIDGSKLKDVKLFPLPAVIGLHGGPGTFAAGYFLK